MANVSPIQTGDGSQPVAAGTFRTRGFAPTPTPTGTTNVTAPLDVRAGPSQASILANQLQMSLQNMHWPMMEAERSEGMAAAKQSYQQGTADAGRGNLDPALMKADANYRAGAAHARVTQAYVQWAPQEVQKLAADPNFVKMTPEQVQDVVDQDARKAFGGLENDPVGAATLSPLLTHFAGEVAGYHIKYANEYNANEQLTNIGSLAVAAASHGAPFDYPSEVSQLAKFQGMPAATQNAASAVINAALASRNPNVLDQIKPAPGQSALPPALQVRIQQARQRIYLQQRPVLQSQDRSAQLKLFSAIANGADVKSAVQSYLQTSPLASPNAITHAYSFGHSLSTEQAQDAANGSDAVDITAAITQGTIGTPVQLYQHIDALGVSGKAREQLMKEGLSTMSQVNAAMIGSPYYKSTLAGVAMRYKPKPPMPGMPVDSSETAQYAGVMSDFAQEYRSAVQKGSTPMQAAYVAEQNVEKKWGAPRNQLSTAATGKIYVAPKTDLEMRELLISDPKQAKAVGIGKDDIQRLWQTGQLTAAQVQAIGEVYLH